MEWPFRDNWTPAAECGRAIAQLQCTNQSRKSKMTSTPDLSRDKKRKASLSSSLIIPPRQKARVIPPKFYPDQSSSFKCCGPAIGGAGGRFFFEKSHRVGCPRAASCSRTRIVAFSCLSGGYRLSAAAGSGMGCLLRVVKPFITFAAGNLSPDAPPRSPFASRQRISANRRYRSCRRTTWTAPSRPA